MNAAGIDVSGRKSTVAVLRPFGEVIKLPFDVRHSAEELASLAEQLKSIEGETRVVMEHTGCYYESIAKVTPSQILCKPPMWCRIEAPHWR